MNELAEYNRIFRGSIAFAVIKGNSLLFEPNRALDALDNVEQSGVHIAVVEVWRGSRDSHSIMEIYEECLAIDDDVLEGPDGVSVAVALARDYITRSLPPTTTYVSFIFTELLPNKVTSEDEKGDVG
jgi:hypothetical protein